MNERYGYVPTEADQMAVTNRMKLFTDMETRPKKPYAFRSSSVDYDTDLGGLTNFFEYVRTLPSKHVLDIGTGDAIGIRQLAQGMGHGLTYEATGLTPPADPPSFPFHITTGEDLLGVRTASVGGAIARFSVAYSAVPEMVVDAIDRVLVPGGVFKGSFYRPYDPRHKAIEGLRLHPPETFNEAFEKRGYDTSYSWGNPVLLCIKPGNNGDRPPVGARDLHLSDSNPFSHPRPF